MLTASRQTIGIIYATYALARCRDCCLFSTHGVDAMTYFIFGLEYLAPLSNARRKPGHHLPAIRREPF